MTSRRQLSVRRAGVLAALAYGASLVGAALAPAAAQGLPLVRDTEIENLLRDYSRPIFRAAELTAQNISVRIIKHDSFNAFVVDGRNVYMNTGTLMTAKTPNEVIGVIAHETGHIKGGHMADLRSRIARDQTKSMLLMLLGIGVMAAGAASGGDTGREMTGAGTGVLMGGNEMVMRSFLSRRREQESAADQAGLSYLERSKQSGQGMLETFERFAQQEYVSDAYQDPFMRSHPVAADRLARLREKVAASPYVNVKDPPALQLRHDMMRAKISGYIERAQTVLNRFPAKDTSLPARYARAIARNCSGRCADNIGEVDALIKDRPDYLYFYELKGNLLQSAGKHGEAIAPLRKALAMSGGGEPLIMTELAQSLIEGESAAQVDEAIDLLRKSTLADDSNALSHHLLAKAFYKKERFPQADLAAAQGHFAEGNVPQAKIFAKRAMAKLPRGSPEWIKAEDIANYKVPTSG
ncbi:MAG: M48 family metalloprotease [Hyphomicrobiaceae bacterium]|nr:M48 family metalloprotease [Hyphomicrobiaceae bacterium]